LLLCFGFFYPAKNYCLRSGEREWQSRQEQLTAPPASGMYAHRSAKNTAHTCEADSQMLPVLRFLSPGLSKGFM